MQLSKNILILSKRETGANPSRFEITIVFYLRIFLDVIMIMSCFQRTFEKALDIPNIWNVFMLYLSHNPRLSLLLRLYSSTFFSFNISLTLFALLWAIGDSYHLDMYYRPGAPTGIKFFCLRMLKSPNLGSAGFLSLLQ